MRTTTKLTYANIDEAYGPESPVNKPQAMRLFGLDLKKEGGMIPLSTFLLDEKLIKECTNDQSSNVNELKEEPVEQVPVEQVPFEQVPFEQVPLKVSPCVSFTTYGYYAGSWLVNRALKCIPYIL